MKKILTISFIVLSLVSVNTTRLSAQTTNKIDTTGSVGIGTLTPGEKLTILDNGDAQGLGIYRNYSASSSAGTYLNFGALDGSFNRIIGSAILGQLNGNKTSGELHFYTKTGSSLIDRMAIDQDGNVGIGTTSPNAKLEVNGNIFTTSQSSYLQFGTSPSTAPYISGDADGNIALGTQNTGKLIVLATGNVGVGTTSPSEKLSVDGNIYANGNISSNGNIKTKKLTVTQTGWSDYVFSKDYKLRTLQQVETFIKQNNHLPELPSAKEVEEKGISVGDNQALLLKKIEELTLYVIDLQKQVTVQAKEIKRLKHK